MRGVTEAYRQDPGPGGRPGDGAPRRQPQPPPGPDGRTAARQPARPHPRPPAHPRRLPLRAGPDALAAI
jgi:hypothetical protein